MRRDITSASLSLIIFTLLLGLAFPLVMTGISQVTFPGNANGQQVFVHGRLVGSKIIGQAFTDPVFRHGKPVLDKNGNPVTTPDPRYFQTRPSATLPADNAAATAFSNLGPN
jgi:K+-transporting ATPase ATPase C chain